MNILLVGGGTAGSVTPLLALRSALARDFPKSNFIFIGTSRGPERQLASTARLDFFPIPAGKLRRYFSLQNITDIFLTFFGFFKVLNLIRQFRPDVIVSAGSFVSVPVVWAGRLRGVPAIVHQQDLLPGLANRLCVPAAKSITTVFEKTVSSFSAAKTSWTGNPVRPELLLCNRQVALRRFGLNERQPVILAFGGGTGALRLNQLITEASLTLVRDAQILHITGGKDETFHIKNPNYHSIDFLTNDMACAYAAADIVVCRAGLSTLSELSALGKPAIVIPLPNTHQEANAKFFSEHQAIVEFLEKDSDHRTLQEAIQELLRNDQKKDELSKNIRSLNRPDAAERLMKITDQIGHPREVKRWQAALSDSGADIMIQESLAKHTNFKIGGPAELFAVCTTRTQLVTAYRNLQREHHNPILLGGGANTVFPDSGIRGVVLQVRNEEFSIEGDEIILGAGINTGKAASLALNAGLTGLEFIVGIYGTVGGAVRGNAGSFGTEMRDVVISCDVLAPDGEISTWSASRLQFGYRDSILKHRDGLIVSVRLRLRHGDSATARKLILEHTSYKRQHQPLAFPSAGCMFKNYQIQPGDDLAIKSFPDYVQTGVIPVWALLTELGLAGKRIGDIQISDRHANFFINVGQGTAEQVVMLASLVKQKVRERFGIQLHEEVQFIGFNRPT